MRNRWLNDFSERLRHNPTSSRIAALSLTIFCTVCGGGSLGGCLSRVHSPYTGPPDDRTIEVRHASPEKPEGAREEHSELAGGHRKISVILPSVGENGQDGNRVHATLFRSITPGRNRLVVVLPIWGSSKYPSKRVIRRLLRGQYKERTHVLVVHGDRALFDWQGMASSRDEQEFLRSIDETTLRFSNTVMDIRRLITWAQTKGDVDPARIGIVGFSMSALVGSLVIGQDSRISAGVLVMGGANLHEIFAACRGRPGETRREVGQRFGWDADTFGRKIQSGLAPINPVRFAGTVHASRVLMVDSAFDHCMPESSREALWEAWDRPERISFSYGHKLSFLSMTPLGFDYTTRRVVGFLDRLLLREIDEH